MEYYYECQEVYEKIVTEVKTQCELIRKLDTKYLVVRGSYLEALIEFEGQREHMSPSTIIEKKKVLDRGKDTLTSIAGEKWKVANCLMVTLEYYLSKIDGYVREFKCEMDKQTPESALTIERRFLDANKERVRQLNSIRGLFPFVDDILELPHPAPEINDQMTDVAILEANQTRMNGHKQTMAMLMENIIRVFEMIGLWICDPVEV